MTMRRSAIIGTGSVLPKTRLSNDELAQNYHIDTSDAWIVERTGIRFRHIADSDETTGTLATEAARRALKNANVAPEEVGLIIVATTTPDYTLPATAMSVQADLGVGDSIAFDVQAVCSGFLYALSVADSMLRTDSAKVALVIGAETFTRLLNWEDRTTCVLFGDGAGAVVLRQTDDVEKGIQTVKLHADGRYKDLLCSDGGVSTTGTVGKLLMKGREVFRHAVTNLVSVTEEALTASGFSASQVDWIVPHQANARILSATAQKLGVPSEQVVMTVDRHANTAAASVPLALDAAVQDGRIKSGDLVVLEAMGGGFTWGAAVIRF
ncbi:MAG: beta-ketoacyl-ACP synthase III [Zymomonas mobilis]|uniref:beta-ketoacyl-ACP synthase III n=1 Tax=Zymomonas mobilis TaxID=542 RepID=UPI0001B705E1|nr:beta-ketoacyl-ACP synthase III [Zymomonas mobilis]ACV75788.1 3-oxoacyl-(acyl-carrier-protein) synthase III [Zymomonas mobilis subsp. mobilis NCIMB 11163]